MSERTVWTIEINFYEETDVSPQTLFDEISAMIYDKYPEFSGVVGMSGEKETADV